LLKKRLYIALSILICCLSSTVLRAQVTFTLTEALITGQGDQAQNQIPSGKFNGFVLGGDIWVKANSSTIPVTSGTSGTSLPLNVARIKVHSITGINIGTINPEITLSTVDQSVASGGITLGGDLFMNYRLVIAGTAWQAGTYNVGLTFSATNTFSRYYTVIVDPYLTMTSNVAATTSINVNSLADFRTNGISSTQTFTYRTSVPTDVTLRAGPNPITFSTTFPKIGDPTLVASAVSAVLTGTAAGSEINLSTSNQPLSVSSGVPVSTTNSSTFTNTLKVSSASLKSNFIQAGTYTYPLTYTISKTSAAQPATLPERTMATTVSIVVPRILEALIPSTGINLNFSNPTHYRDGVTASMPSPITLSSTIPYNVTVRAASNFTLNGNTIPAGVMIVEGASGQTGVNSLTLSTTAQNLISSSAPVIDRAVNLQYRIPSTQTSNLLNKTAGQYAADVIFTITAP
jgi:hypothetical protein